MLRNITQVFKLDNPNIPRVKEAFIIIYEKGVWFQWNGSDVYSIDMGESGGFLNLLSAKMYTAKCNPKLFTGRKCKWVEITVEEYYSTPYLINHGQII